MPFAENKRRMLSRREMLALTGVFGASLLFGLVPGAMRAIALEGLKPTPVTDIMDRRLFLRSNTMAILNGELLFSKKPSEFDEIYGNNEIDSAYPFHWEFKENFQFQWSQDTDATDDNNMSNDTMFSGWCLVPNASNKAAGVLNVKWDPDESDSVDEGDEAAPELMLSVADAGYDAWGRPINIEMSVRVANVCTGSSARKVDKSPTSRNTTYIPVLVWANNLPAAGSSSTTGNGRGPTFWLADGKPSEANVVALSLGVNFIVSLSDAGSIPPPGVSDGDWSLVPQGDFVVNCYDMDQPSWWHLYKTGEAQTWGRTVKYVESMWTPAPNESVDEGDVAFSFFNKAYRPANPLVTHEQYSTEWSTEHWYWFPTDIGNTLNVRWSGKAKGVSENYDRNAAVLVASDGTSSSAEEEWATRNYNFGWQGSGCKSILSFGSEKDSVHFVETRIIGGLGKVVYPNGKVVRTFDPEDVTDRTDNPYMRKYFFKGATPGAYGLNTGALKSDGKPPYTFTPADGWRIEYLRYRKYTSAQNGAWTNVNVGDGTEPIALFDRPHGCGVLPWAKIKNDWQCEVKFVENVGKLWLYKHDAESPDHSAQGDGVLGGDRAYGAPSNPGATFKVWRKDGSQFFYKGTKVSEATAKVPQNSPTAYAEFSQIEVGEYYWQEIAAPDGYRIDTTRHEVTITPWRAEGDAVTATCSNYIKRGGVRLKKIDFDSTIDNANKHKIDLEWGEPQGNATLAGAEFKVYSISAQGVKANGQWFPATYHSAADIRNPGSAAGCLLTLVTNENGEVSSANNVLPYGTYVIFETKAPAGYLLNEAFAAGVAFTIREDGGYVQFNGHEGYLT